MIDVIRNLKIPKSLIRFYKQANPIDVEVVLDDLTSVKFFPVNALEDLQSEYDLSKDSFVFASREGDPILIKEQKIYTQYMGKTIGN